MESPLWGQGKGSFGNGMGCEVEVSPWGRSKHTLCA